MEILKATLVGKLITDKVVFDKYSMMNDEYLETPKEFNQLQAQQHQPPNKPKISSTNGSEFENLSRRMLVGERC